MWDGTKSSLATQFAPKGSQAEQTETEQRRANPASGGYLLVAIYPVNLAEPRDNRLKPRPSPSGLMLSIASVEPVSGTERAVPKTFGKLIDVSNNKRAVPGDSRLKMWTIIGTNDVRVHVCRVKENQISRIETVCICSVENQGRSGRKDEKLSRSINKGRGGVVQMERCAAVHNQRQADARERARPVIHDSIASQRDINRPDQRTCCRRRRNRRNPPRTMNDSRCRAWRSPRE